LKIKICILFAVVSIFLSSVLVIHAQAAGFDFRDDFNYAELDQMKNAGWTINRPSGTGVDSGAVILDGTGGDTLITYKNHFPSGIYDWKAETRGMWLGEGRGTLSVAVTTEYHSYSWSGDGYYSEFIFYKDSQIETRFSGYADELGEWFTLSMERKGDTLYCYCNGELEYNYTEEDTRPSQVTSISLISPWAGDAKYDYYHLWSTDSEPNAFTADVASALDLNPDYFVRADFSVDENAIAFVTGSKGFAAPLEGDSFLVLSSGNAQPSAFPAGWLGTPVDRLSVYNQNPAGTGPLGGSASDIATLSLRLKVPDWAKSLSFDFQFLSEEYPDSVNQAYSDYFSCMLDGMNIVFDPEDNIMNLNNNFLNSSINPEGTVFNATTGWLTTETAVTGGTTITLDFIVGDVGDENLDSAVFLDNLSFSIEEAPKTITFPTRLDTDEPVRESSPLLVAAAVGTTVAAASVLVVGLGPAFNSVVSSLPIPKQLVSFLKFYGASLFQKVDKVKLEALEKVPLITRAELVSIGLSVSIITLVYSFVAANGLPAFLDSSVLAVVIPSTFFSSCVVVITKVFSGIFCAKTCNIYRKFSLWKTGVLMFIVSGLLFLFPFSSPGVTRYQSGEISKQTKALIVLSKTLILLTLTIPFTSLFLLGFRTIGDSGLMLTLMSAFFSLVPLKLLSGKAVFDYRKDVSLIALVLTGTLFFSCTFNVLPMLTYLALGLASAVMAAITIKKLKHSH